MRSQAQPRCRLAAFARGIEAYRGRDDIAGLGDIARVKKAARTRQWSQDPAAGILHVSDLRGWNWPSRRPSPFIRAPARIDWNRMMKARRVSTTTARSSVKRTLLDVTRSRPRGAKACREPGSWGEMYRVVIGRRPTAPPRLQAGKRRPIEHVPEVANRPSPRSRPQGHKSLRPVCGLSSAQIEKYSFTTGAGSWKTCG